MDPGLGRGSRTARDPDWDGRRTGPWTWDLSPGPGPGPWPWTWNLALALDLELTGRPGRRIPGAGHLRLLRERPEGVPAHPCRPGSGRCRALACAPWPWTRNLALALALDGTGPGPGLRPARNWDMDLDPELGFGSGPRPGTATGARDQVRGLDPGLTRSRHLKNGASGTCKTGTWDRKARA
jgi:hypothetical protein